MIGDGVLYLQARVDFQKTELARAGVVQKFHRARAGAFMVPRDAGHALGGREHGQILVIIQERVAAFFYNLLVATLDRALANPHGQTVEDLHFHVDRFDNKLFQVKIRIVVQVPADAARRFHRRVHFRFSVNRHHALPAAARVQFHQNRISDGTRGRPGLFHATDQTRTGKKRDVVFLREPPGGQFVTHAPHDRGRRPHEQKFPSEPVLNFGDGLREIRVFGQKSVTGINRARPGQETRGDHHRNVRIIAGRADEHGLTREIVPGLADIGLGYDGHGGNVFLMQREKKPFGDFAAIRHQNFLQTVRPGRGFGGLPTVFQFGVDGSQVRERLINVFLVKFQGCPPDRKNRAVSRTRREYAHVSSTI